MIATVVMTALDSHPVLSDAENNFCYFFNKEQINKSRRWPQKELSKILAKVFSYKCRQVMFSTVKIMA